jgi:hypothetical protein
MSETLLTNKSGTHSDGNLLAAERQLCSWEMLTDLGSMPAVLIFDPCDVKSIAVCFTPTFDGRRTQSLDAQLGAEPHPLYTSGIADKNFKLVEL